jgi:CubicO group peptidase (beta-lactamase class C family)
VEFGAVADLANQDAFLSSVIPAANIYATADEACRFYQMLLDGGRWNGQQLFERRSVAEAIQPAGKLTLDRTLLVPVRFSPGFVLGEWPAGLYGPGCARAFGHLGFMSILTWADPARDLSVALLNTGKSAEPAGLAALMQVLFSIARNCPALPQCALPAPQPH